MRLSSEGFFLMFVSLVNKDVATQSGEGKIVFVAGFNIYMFRISAL